MYPNVYFSDILSSLWFNWVFCPHKIAQYGNKKSFFKVLSLLKKTNNYKLRTGFFLKHNCIVACGLSLEENVLLLLWF